jgi:hypothetical protein
MTDQSQTLENLDPDAREAALRQLLAHHNLRRHASQILYSMQELGYDTKTIEAVIEKSRWEASSLLDNLGNLPDV